MTLSLAAEAAMRTVGGDDAETVAMMGSATRKLEEVAVMEAEAAVRRVDDDEAIKEEAGGDG